MLSGQDKASDSTDARKRIVLEFVQYTKATEAGLEQTLPQLTVQAVTIVINQKGVEQGLSRTEEYALFCFQSKSAPALHTDDLLSPQLEDPTTRMSVKPLWEWLQRGGNNETPAQRSGLFFPIYIDAADCRRRQSSPARSGATRKPARGDHCRVSVRRLALCRP